MALVDRIRIRYVPPAVAGLDALAAIGSFAGLDPVTVSEILADPATLT